MGFAILQPDEWFTQNYAVEIWNVVLGVLCFAALATCCGILAQRVYHEHRLHKHWSVFCHAIVQWPAHLKALLTSTQTSYLLACQQQQCDEFHSSIVCSPHALHASWWSLPSSYQ